MSRGCPLPSQVLRPTSYKTSGGEPVYPLPSYKEVINKVVRFAASVTMVMYSRKKQDFPEDYLLRLCLTKFLDSSLALPLKHQGMGIVLGEVLKLEDSEGDFRFRVTIFTERKPVWGLTIETRSVKVVNTLEKAAVVHCSGGGQVPRLQGRDGVGGTGYCG